MAQFEALEPEHAAKAQAAFAAQPDAPVAAPPQAPTPQGPLMSSPKGFYGPGFLANLESRLTGKTPQQAYEQRVPQLEKTADILGSVVGPGVLGKIPKIGQALAGGGLARQALTQGGITGGLGLLGGKGPLQAGKEALGSAAGAGVMGGLGKAAGAAAGLSGQTTGALFRAGEKRAAEIADQLKKDAPVLDKFSSNVRGLKQMLLGQRGFNTMHDAYDASIKKAVAKAGDQQISIPREVAKEIGFKVETGVTPAPSGRNFEVPMVNVAAGDAVERILGKGGTRGYRVVSDALAEKGLVDPEMRKAYATWSGLRDYFSRAGAFSPRGFDLYAAQQAANKAKGADILNRRQLGPYGEMLGPEITKGTFKGPGAVAGGALEGAAGLSGGHMFGLGPLGALLGVGIGAKQGAYLGNKVPRYTGLPTGPLAGPLQAIAPSLGTRAGAVLGKQVAE